MAIQNRHVSAIGVSCPPGPWRINYAPPFGMPDSPLIRLIGSHVVRQEVAPFRRMSPLTALVDSGKMGRSLRGDWRPKGGWEVALSRTVFCSIGFVRLAHRTQSHI